MADRQHEDRVGFHKVSIQRHVAGAAARDQQLTQSMFSRPSNQEMTLQNPEAID